MGVYENELRRVVSLDGVRNEEQAKLAYNAGGIGLYPSTYAKMTSPQSSYNRGGKPLFNVICDKALKHPEGRFDHIAANLILANLENEPFLHSAREYATTTGLLTTSSVLRNAFGVVDSRALLGKNTSRTKSTAASRSRSRRLRPVPPAKPRLPIVHEIRGGTRRRRSKRSSRRGSSRRSSGSSRT
jgi:hypothetical protein